MCTAITYRTRHHYFGRNLDLEYHYHETVTITPRRYPFNLRHQKAQTCHYAMIGMATVADGYPLYYEATNEIGLSMAGLNFPGNAVYHPLQEGMDNIAPFEFIPWILSQCSTVHQAEKLLKHTNLCDTPFSDRFPLSPLHWMIADRDESIVVECMQDGMHVHKNPVGVLTNNPPFPMQLLSLNNYMHMSPGTPKNTFAPQLNLAPYSLGMGAMGLPGDLSSPSRFIRAAFTRMNALADDTESASVSQFFHILGSVSQPRGCTLVRENEYEITLYASCCNSDTGVYYFRTYENNRICAVDMHKEDLDSDRLIPYPLPTVQDILPLN